MNVILDSIANAVKAFLIWVYNWITVLTGIIAGALVYLPDILTVVGGTDLRPFGISPDKAAAVTTAVALTKGIIAAVQSRRGST